jgi:translation initiation factor 3 subunit E
MVEMVGDEYDKLSADTELTAEYAASRDALEQRKDAIFAAIDNAPADVLRVVSLFANEEVIGALKSSDNLSADTLASQFGVSGADLEAYLKFGKFKYECGMYQEAEAMLSNYLSVTGRGTSPLGALWGRLACRILQADWEHAREDLKAVKAAVDGRGLSAVDQLRQRAWLMHWSLFVLLNQRDGMDALAEFLADKAYLSAMENLCPWMLRYYVAAAVLSPRRRVLMRDVLSEIQLLSSAYSDPLTQVLEALYEHFDFNAAQQVTTLMLSTTLKLMSLRYRDSRSAA